MLIRSDEMHLPARLNPGMAEICDNTHLASADIYPINKNPYFHGLGCFAVKLSKLW
jgi:hypothetical protein